MDEHVIQMRWADLDMLNHVNNVRYVDYADEARAAWVESGAIEPGLSVSRCDVEFLKPLTLSRKPVSVSGEIDGRRLVQLIHRGDELFARITTDLSAERPLLDQRGKDAEPFPFQLRRTDASGGVVGNAKHFEIFQEARILVMSQLIRVNSAGGFVAARVDIEFAEDVAWRAEPYPVRTWVDRYGRSSIDLSAEIIDGDRVYARAHAVLVAFDPAAQRSRPLSEEERAHLDTANSNPLTS